MDDLDTQKKFAESLKLPFPLLADPKGEVVRAYGVEMQHNGKTYADRVTFVHGDASGYVADEPVGIARSLHVRLQRESRHEKRMANCYTGKGIFLQVREQF